MTKAVPLRKWTHIVVTAMNMDAAKPDLAFYINGALHHVEKSAWLPQQSSTSNNYIGKSNWANDTSMYQNADELFKGKLFDFRGYQTPMNQQKVKKTYTWGKALLGL